MIWTITVNRIGRGTGLKIYFYIYPSMQTQAKLAYSRVGIIHGYQGSGATHWQSWLARKCKALGAETHFPKLPDRFGQPKLSAWLEAIERTMPVIDEATALVGHSLGYPTILQLLKNDRIEAVGLVVLVSPSSRSRVEESNLSFLAHFYDGLNTATGAKARRIEVYASDNDPWVDPLAARDLATDLEACFHLIHGGGHLNTAAGYHTFPEILALLGGLQTDS